MEAKRGEVEKKVIPCVERKEVEKTEEKKTFVKRQGKKRAKQRKKDLDDGRRDNT